MNEFQQYQQQLQMQRMMEMQQARMQQLQQQQNNMMLFSQQRAYMGSLVNPLGGAPLAGGAVGMGLMSNGAARQSLLGAAIDAGRFNFAGIGTSGGLNVLGLNTAIGNRIGFRFADANRGITQARAEDALAGFGTGFTTGLIPGLTDSLGLGFINRARGTQGLVNINDRAAGVMDVFQGVRGAGASGVEGRGLSRVFATNALIGSSRRLGSAMPELNAEEIQKIQGLAMGSMSTAQLSMAARSESDFDKVMESQEALLKKIAENTKMSVDEIKETNKVFKGQGGAGGSMRAMQSISAAVAGMASTTDATQQELVAMGAGFRSGARNLGMRGLNNVAGLMLSRADAQMGRFNRGLIDETDMAAFGGTTAMEQAAATQQALLQRSRQFAVVNQTTLGLLGGSAGAIAASQGFGGLQQAVGAQIAADPINAAANAVFTREGQAALDTNTLGAMQTAFQEANAYRGAIPGAGRAIAIQRFAQSMNLTPQQALAQFERIEGMQGRIEALGAAGRGLSPDVLDAIDNAATQTGLGDRTAEVASLIQSGVDPETAIRRAYVPRSQEDVQNLLAANPDIRLQSAGTLLPPGSADYFNVDTSNRVRHVRDRERFDRTGRSVNGEDISIEQLMGADTQYDTHNRGADFESLFSNQTFQNTLRDLAMPRIRIANEDPPALGTSTNPSYTIVLDAEEFARTVGG